MGAQPDPAEVAVLLEVRVAGIGEREQTVRPAAGGVDDAPRGLDLRQGRQAPFLAVHVAPFRIRIEVMRQEPAASRKARRSRWSSSGRDGPCRPLSRPVPRHLELMVQGEVGHRQDRQELVDVPFEPVGDVERVGVAAVRRRLEPVFVPDRPPRSRCTRWR